MGARIKKIEGWSAFDESLVQLLVPVMQEEIKSKNNGLDERKMFQSCVWNIVRAARNLSAGELVVRYLKELFAEQKSAPITIDHKTIAQHCGLKRETVTNILIQLRRQGKIRYVRKQLTILNLDRINYQRLVKPIRR